jgi:hypothetical protein
LKGLGIARRIDEAFEILESIEKDTTVGSPRLSPHLICGFLNALIEAGWCKMNYFTILFVCCARYIVPCCTNY